MKAESYRRWLRKEIVKTTGAMGTANDREWAFLYGRRAGLRKALRRFREVSV